MNATLRWWLGNILFEMKRLPEAERYFRSFAGRAWDPVAAYRLARVYEEMGELAQARQAYELFVESWRDADPELQPMVAEARAAVQRLSSAIKE